MASSEEVLNAPRCPDLPAMPSDDFWNNAQWATFWAIMDALAPSVLPKSTLTDSQAQLGVLDTEYQTAFGIAHNAVAKISTKEALIAYLEDRPSTNPAVRGALVRLLANLPTKQRDGLGKLMSSLSCVLPKVVLKRRRPKFALLTLENLQFQHYCFPLDRLLFSFSSAAGSHQRVHCERLASSLAANHERGLQITRQNHPDMLAQCFAPFP